MLDYDPRDRDRRYDENNRSARSGAPPHTGRAATYGLLLVLGVLVGLGVWGAVALVHHFRGEQAGTNPNAQEREPTPAAPLDVDEKESVALFEKVRDSVVNVDVVMVRQAAWGQQATETATSGGSGFIWDTDGRIVTNFHVVADLLKRPDLLELRVVFPDRSSYKAELIGASADNDLAVVQVTTAPKDKLKPISVGTSHDLKVGQKAFAIGNPFALSLTMTKGIISSLNRIIESPSGARIPHVIQTDAAINPGNSGGPLLDKSGRLIGVNTSIATAGGVAGNIGIGFAIPVDTVNRVATELIRNGRYLRPSLGVKLYDERRLRQARYDTGVMIDRVAPGGPAAKAGLRGVKYNARGVPEEPGDLIVGINGQKIDNVEDYERVVHDLKVGQQVKVKFIRGTTEMEATLTVAGV
jgi:S1-C subfamily serine protease